MPGSRESPDALDQFKKVLRGMFKRSKKPASTPSTNADTETKQRQQSLLQPPRISTRPSTGRSIAIPQQVFTPASQGNGDVLEPVATRESFRPSPIDETASASDSLSFYKRPPTPVSPSKPQDSAPSPQSPSIPSQFLTNSPTTKSLPPAATDSETEPAKEHVKPADASEAQEESKPEASAATDSAPPATETTEVAPENGVEGDSGALSAEKTEHVSQDVAKTAADEQVTTEPVAVAAAEEEITEPAADSTAPVTAAQEEVVTAAATEEPTASATKEETAEEPSAKTPEEETVQAAESTTAQAPEEATVKASEKTNAESTPSTAAEGAPSSEHVIAPASEPKDTSNTQDELKKQAEPTDLEPSLKSASSTPPADSPVPGPIAHEETHHANEAARRAPAIYHDEKIPVMAEPPIVRPLTTAPGMVATSGPLEDFPFR